MRSKPEESVAAESAWTRVARGAKAGLRWSLALCLIAVVQSLAGSSRLRGEPPLPVILAFYAAAGAALGAVTAALVPLMRYLPGTIAVCALWGFTLYSGAAVIVNGAAAYTPRVPLLLGGALGVVTGFVVWRAIRAGDPPPAA
jgi:hypothetical protein